MNQGLEILIARAKTHPEEFIAEAHQLQSRWSELISRFGHHMTEEEKEAWGETEKELKEWYANKRRDDFTEAVMKELLIREGEEEIDRAVRPKKLVTAASMTHDALTILAGGGGGGGGGGYGGGGGGSVVVKTRTGTHTFTKNGVVTVEGDEQVTWLPKP